MSDWKTRLQDSITLIICSVIFLVLLILGIYILSYVIIAVALIGIVVFVVAQVSSWFSNKKGVKKDKSKHRTIDHDDSN